MLSIIPSSSTRGIPFVVEIVSKKLPKCCIGEKIQIFHIENKHYSQTQKDRAFEK